jgi:gliding motility-associated-like protein
LVSIVGVKNFELVIFNRWGEKMFETDNIYKGWNGKLGEKLSEQGMYTFKVYYKLISGEEDVVHGSFMLLR